MQPNDFEYLGEKIGTVGQAVKNIVSSQEVGVLIFYLKIFGTILTFLFLAGIILLLTWMHVFDPIILSFKRFYKRISFRKKHFVKKLNEVNELLAIDNAQKNFEGLVLLKKLTYYLLDYLDVKGKNLTEKINNIPVDKLTNRAELLEAFKVFDEIFKNPHEFLYYSNLPTVENIDLYRPELDLIIKEFNQLFRDFKIIE